MIVSTSAAERVNPSVTRWQQALDLISRRIRVAMPAIVQSFDAAKQTVIVKIAITEEMDVIDANGNMQKMPKALPVLTDLPIIMPRGGGFAITLPVQQGDECLVVLGDMAIDSWWQSGGSTNNQIADRRHDISDGFAILGPWSQPRVLSDYASDALEIRKDDGSVKIKIASDQIEIDGNSKVTVNAETVDVHATGTATVRGETVNVTGDSAVNLGSNVKIDDKVFLTHTHSLSPSGATGPVI